MTAIFAVLAATVMSAGVVLLTVLRAGIRQQEHAGSLTRRICCLHARLPERAVSPADPADPFGRSG